MAAFIKNFAKTLHEQKYNIFTLELHHPVILSNSKIHFVKYAINFFRKMQYHDVCNKMEIDPIPNEFKDLKCLEKT